MTTFDAGPAARFIGATAEARDGFAIFGVPYDGTASFRAGARFGPDAIRAASDGLETYSPALDRDLEEIAYADLGNVPVGFGDPRPALAAVEEAVTGLVDAGVVPVMLGGEHSLTAAAVRALSRKHEGLVVLQLDAHADLRDAYLDDPNSHACAMRRCLDAGVELIQFGIRSGTREEWGWMRAHDTVYDLDRLSHRLRSLTAPLYVTVDIDVFDPAVVAGTGTPEPGGVTWREFESVVELLSTTPAPVVGLDVMELAPTLDPTGVSSVVAAKVTRELLLAVA